MLTFFAQPWQEGRISACQGPAPPPDPVAWARAALGFQADPRQAEVLRSTHPRGLLCCTRQWGKSTVTAIKALHYAWFHPGSLIIIAGPSLRQPAEWMEKTQSFLHHLNVKPRGDGHNACSLVLPNRSRMVGLPCMPKNTRGFSKVALLLFDEASYVPDSLYHALCPMLAVSRGALWLMSTPSSQSGFFYESWHNSAVDWARFRVPAPECPRISPDFLDFQRLALGEHAFRREYMCEFLASDSQIISREMIDLAFVDDLPFNNGKPLWHL